jgi:hypothetical protein
VLLFFIIGGTYAMPPDNDVCTGNNPVFLLLNSLLQRPPHGHLLLRGARKTIQASTTSHTIYQVPFSRQYLSMLSPATQRALFFTDPVCRYDTYGELSLDHRLGSFSSRLRR